MNLSSTASAINESRPLISSGMTSARGKNSSRTRLAMASVTPANGRALLPAFVEIAEQLGPETFAYVRIDGLEVVEIGERPVELAGALACRLDGRSSIGPGQHLELAVDPTALHLFDPESGSSLLAG